MTFWTDDLVKQQEPEENALVVKQAEHIVELEIALAALRTEYLGLLRHFSSVVVGLSATVEDGVARLERAGQTSQKWFEDNT
jgi:hypothetical protein